MSAVRGEDPRPVVEELPLGVVRVLDQGDGDHGTTIADADGVRPAGLPRATSSGRKVPAEQSWDSDRAPRPPCPPPRTPCADARHVRSTSPTSTSCCTPRSRGPG